MAVSDLTNTKWLFNNAPSVPSTRVMYNITFKVGNNTYNGLYLNQYVDPMEPTPPYDIIVYDDGTYMGVAVYENGAWTSDTYKTIEITGGTDVTNATLIAWLEENATQQGGGTTGKTQIGTRAITKKMFGTREITKEVVNGVVVYEK